MTTFDDLAARLVGFDWDSGNAQKNWERHEVTQAESEQLFFNRPVMAAEDVKHSAREPRYNLLGRTNADRLLSVIFTVREDLARVIAARPMSRKERSVYAQVTNDAP